MRRNAIFIISSIAMVFLLLGVTYIPKSYAVTYELTGSGLGLHEGNYGTSLTISSELSLSALTKGNTCGYPTGLPGTIYVHKTYGIGVQNGQKKGEQQVNGGDGMPTNHLYSISLRQ